jgi:hypothetical protein
MKIKFLLVTFFVFVLNSITSYGQVAAWDFNGESSPATSTADVFNVGLDGSSTITRGAGAASSAGGNSFRTVGFQNNGIAVANTDYFQITLSAASGNTLSLSTIDARFVGTATFANSPGVSSQFAYSLDGTTFTLIGSPQVTVGQPVTMTQISLSGIAALQNVADTVTIYIRYYASGQTTTGGWGFNSPSAGAYGLAIGGTVNTGITTRANGDWYDTNTWTGFVVPTSAQSAIINHTVTNTTTTPANIVRNLGTTTTINSGASLAPGAFTYTGAGTTTVVAGGTLIISNTYTNSGSTGVAGTVRMDQGGSVATNAFAYSGTSTLILNGSSGLFAVSTPVHFWPTSGSPFNVVVQGTGAQINNAVGTVAGTLTVNSQLNVSVASGLTVSGTAVVNTQLNVVTASGLLITGILQLNSGGFINTNSPVYGASSTLRYNTTYSRNLEWTQDVTATIGTTPGYPNHVHVTNSSALTYYNASNNGAKGINGNLTIDALSSLTFTGTSTAGALTVKGNVANAGTLTLGAVLGDDIKTAGNFSNTGTFTGNNRAIWFIKGGTQTLSSSASPFTVPYIVTDNGSTVQLLVSVTIAAPLTGYAIDFKNFSDIIDLNGFNLIVGTVGINNTINGSGSFKGNTSSDLTFNGGTGSVGTFKMVTDYSLRNFTLNRQSATVGCVLGSAVTVSTALALTNGVLDLGNNPLTLGATGTIAGAPTNYIIADLANGANPLAALRKVFLAPGSFTFPIGDLSTSANGSQYSPITVTFSGGSYGGYAGFAVDDLQDPNLVDAPNHYITRYWSMTTSGIAPTSYNITANYLTADIVGTESSSQSNQWNGTTWLNNGGIISGNTLTLTAATALTTTNHITAGRREQEINIKHVATNVPSGSIFTNFGTVTIGSTTTITFTIENLGQQSLLLGTATLTGANYSTNYSYTNGSPGSVAGFSSTTFTITFTNPTSSGLYTGSISITNTDANENPYVINFECTVVCPTIAITSVTPTSGPEGTNVTINASGGDLSGTTVNFGGIAATIISSSSTQLVVTVPTGATTGNINVVKTATSCVTTTPFTVIRTTGACSLLSDLIMTEVYDKTLTSLGYIEIYNGTGNAINLTGYSIRRYADNTAFLAGTYTNYAFVPGLTTIADGAVKYGKFSTDPDSATPDFNYTVTLGAPGINGDDILHLYNGATLIDAYIVSTSTAGYVARRNTATLGPNPTSTPADWTLTQPEAESNLGTFGAVHSSPPTVTTDPVDVTTCNNTATFTAAGTAVGAGTITYQWYYNSGIVTGWTAVAANSFAGVTVTGFAVSSLTLSGSIGSITGYQFYCSVIQSGACASTSDAAQLYVNSTTWNGTAWSNSAPSLTVGAVITGSYNMSTPTSLPSFEACSLTINSPAIVTVDTTKFIAIQNDLTVNTGGSLIVENSGSLVMISDTGVVTNNGTTQIKRTTSPFELYDYTYWSSPIDRPTLSTQFAGWRTDYAFQFLTPNFYDALTINSAGTVTSAVADSFDDIAPAAWQGYTGQMANGQGYAIMGPTNLGTYPNTTSVVFSGKVNNGVIMPKIYETANTDTGYVGVNNANDDYNLVGNPYPSAISADKFITTNGAKISGALYFWTHVANVSVSNPGPDVYNFISDDYAVYTFAGGTGTRASLTGSSIPTGFIASGQGFFVEAQANNVDLVFNNDMRIKTPNVGVYHNNANFYRTSVNGSEKDRIWLNLQNADGMFGQLLVAYFDETTLGHDWGFDGRVNQINNYVSFYSLAPNEKYKIQARPTFEESDIVPLGYFSAVAGEFNINIDQKEGILNADATNIYIEDLDMHIIHDLKASPYTFTTASGKFESRFLLRYTDGSALNNPDFDTLNNSVVVAGNEGQMTIKSYLQTMEEVMVYDVLGRLLFNQKGIGTNDFSANNISMSQQSVIVKIKLESGTIVTKKVLLN